MTNSGPAAINNVSDTALLVAGCRATECEKVHALVRDPFAARLAGERGLAMFRALPHPEVMGFGIGLRTRFVDELLLEAVQSAGITTVVSLGSGLDTRPWRLALPPEVRWIEVDFSSMLDYKDAVLTGEKPSCRRERLSADLTDPAQRRFVYAAVRDAPALILTEGFLMYLSARVVEAISAEASQEKQFKCWITDATTTGFSKALGGTGSSSVRHVQPDDHLTGEQVLETLSRAGWVTTTHRSYIRDLAFARERIAEMMEGKPQPTNPPNFPQNDASGVHLLSRV